MLESLSKRKKPRDDSIHHNFSITKHARPVADFGQPSRQREAFWQILENKLENDAMAAVADKRGEAGWIAVKRAQHRRSPYVLALPGRAAKDEAALRTKQI